MSAATVSMLILVATFGLINVTDNLVKMGLASIPSWLVVGFLYFLPLALILAEFASDTTRRGGIYSFMERGLGPFWAFVGTWSYFVSNLIYLQTSLSKLPVRMSLAIEGRDIFADHPAIMPLVGLIFCLVITWIATRGVGAFSRLAAWSGWATLALTVVLIATPLLLVGLTIMPSATTFTVESLAPRFDVEYFATFSWLLFAVAGAEVAAPYVNETQDPARSFPRAILASTLWVGGAYILASVAVATLIPVGDLTLATGLFDVWRHLGQDLGLPGDLVARACMTVIVVTTVLAMIVWAESPIRAMFAEVPRGTFPEGLLQCDRQGTHHQALWTQAVVVSILTLIPLLNVLVGLSASEQMLSLLNDMASLSLVVPYVFIAIAYIQARRNGMDAPFKMTRSTPAAIAVGVLVLVVSGLGYFGAGLYAFQEEPVRWSYVAVVYGGPLALIGVGVVLRAWSMRVHAVGSTE